MTPVKGCVCVCVSYRVQEDGEEELSSSDALVQLFGASRVFVVEYSVGEQTTGLPGQHLHRSFVSY